MKNLENHLIALENLLESASASELHTSLEDLFFSYLAEKNVVLPTDELVQHILLFGVVFERVGVVPQGYRYSQTIPQMAQAIRIT